MERYLKDQYENRLIQKETVQMNYSSRTASTVWASISCPNQLDLEEATCNNGVGQT